MITLNVGGTIYTTSIETLTRYPDSMLGTMFKTQHEDSGTRLDPSNKDEHGRFVIDRDGPMFRFVLNFLRVSKLILPKDFKELDLLREEAEFYQIEPLIEAVGKLVGEAVDMIDPKSSSKLEWVWVEHTRGLWIVFGKQEILDRIKTVWSTGLSCYPQFIPRDISVTRFDVLLETVLRNNAQRTTNLPADIRRILESSGFVMFSQSSEQHSSHCFILVRRTYPDK